MLSNCNKADRSKLGEFECSLGDWQLQLGCVRESYTVAAECTGLESCQGLEIISEHVLHNIEILLGALMRPVGALMRKRLKSSHSSSCSVLRAFQITKVGNVHHPSKGVRKGSPAYWVEASKF